MKTFFSISILYVSCLSSLSYGQATFNENFKKGSAASAGNGVLQTPDGGYVVTGEIGAVQLPDSSWMNGVLLARLSQSGDTLWTKIYSISNSTSRGKSIVVAKGHYFISGDMTDTSTGMNSLFLLKTDTGGNALWLKGYTSIPHEAEVSMVLSSDTNLMLAGKTSFFFPDSIRRFQVLKVNLNSDILWTKAYSGNDIYSIQPTLDGGLIMAGGSRNLLIVKTNPNGDTAWTKGFNTNGDLTGYWAMQAADSSYLVSGNEIITDSSCLYGKTYSTFLMKMNSAGDTLWKKVWDFKCGTPAENSFVLNEQSDYVLSVGTGCFCPSGGGITHFFKIDPAGTTLWARGYFKRFYSLNKTSDGGYIATGIVNSLPFSMEIIKTGSDGDACSDFTDSLATSAGRKFASASAGITAENLIPTISSFTTTTSKGADFTLSCQTSSTATKELHAAASTGVQFFPNPFHAFTRITIKGQQDLMVLKIFDLTGRELRSVMVSGSAIIERGNLSSGIYFWKVTDEQGIFFGAGKIIAE